MYNYFPECHLYLIGYPPGGCGSLLVSIISYMLFPKEELPKEGILSNAHSMTMLAKTTHEFSKYSESRMDLPNILLRSKYPLYEIVRPKHSKGVMILWDHSTVYDYKSLSSLYPNFTEIVVTVKPKDKNYYDLMHFLKFGEVDCFENWLHLQNKTIELDPTYKWIYNYIKPSDLIKNKDHLKLFSSLHFNSTYNNHKILGNFSEFEFNNHKNKNSKFASNIHSIDFKTIVTDSDTVLTQISNILKLPVTNKSKIIYERWIKKQVLLDIVLDK